MMLSFGLILSLHVFRELPDQFCDGCLVLIRLSSPFLANTMVPIICSTVLTRRLPSSCLANQNEFDTQITGQRLPPLLRMHDRQTEAPSQR